MSPTDDSLESVQRSLVLSSLILLPCSKRAATAEALSWESSSDSSRVHGFLGNTGSSSSMSRMESRSGRGVSGLDDEDCLGRVLTAMSGEFWPLPCFSVLVMSLKGCDSGWASALGGDDPL